MGALANLNKQTIIRKIARRVDKMPGMPQVVHRVMEISGNPEYSTDDLVNTVNQDPGLTANVLKRCNSAFFGLRNRASSLDQAVVLLGLDNVLEVTLSAGVSHLLKGKQEGYRLEQGQLWRHSLATAMAAKKLAEIGEYPDPGEVFTAGLLHDLGKHVLNEFVAPSFNEIYSLVVDQGWALDEAETKVLGVGHAKLGGALAKKWNFPDSIRRAIAYHHSPEDCPSPRVVTNLIALANYFVIENGYGCGLCEDHPSPPGSVLLDLNISRKERIELGGEIVLHLEKAAELIEMS